MKKLSFIGVLLTISLLSCKKKTVINSNSISIVGKWSIKNVVSKYTYADKSFQDEYIAERMDSFYFGDHGSFTFLYRGMNKDAKYSLLSDNKILFYELSYPDEPETYEIKSLTNNNFKLYNKVTKYDEEQDMPYDEETEINLFR